MQGFAFAAGTHVLMFGLQQFGRVWDGKKKGGEEGGVGNGKGHGNVTKKEN